MLMSKGRPIDPQLYVRVLQSVEEGVLAFDRNGLITLSNPSAQSYTGISERQSLGRHFQDLFAGQDNLLYLIRTAISEERSISDHEDVLLLRPLPPPMPVGVTVSPIFTDAGQSEGVVLILRDLTRVRELEDAVHRADRLSMLGTLATGLAHEIKNPLGGIKGAAQLLNMELPSDSPLREYTQVMSREVERVNSIIEELMDLSRPRPPQWSSVNLAKVLGDIVLFQKEALRGQGIEFALHLDPSIPPIRGDENLLTRLFLNLIKNAGEAIERSGRVEISSRIAADYCYKPGDRPMRLVMVDIRDNGRGIAADQLDTIFTPFFTTKDRGSGLGLAICQKIVNDHRGFLRVDSSAGEGTTFSVALPFIPLNSAF
jgi:two-component system, NtrC family, nitrogen regulation sensor histidine kinase GlnL